MSSASSGMSNTFQTDLWKNGYFTKLYSAYFYKIAMENLGNEAKSSNYFVSQLNWAEEKKEKSSWIKDIKILNHTTKFRFG